MIVSGSPKRWAWWHSPSPIGSIYHLYTTYILPSGGLYATYHLLGEPETTLEKISNKMTKNLVLTRFANQQVLETSR